MFGRRPRVSSKSGHVSMSLGRATLLFAVALVTPATAAMTKYEYTEKAAEWRKSHSKDDFLSQFNKDLSNPVEGPRADRLWNYFQEQLDNSGLRFKDDGTVQYSLPITHIISPFVPNVVAEGLEAVAKVGRKMWYFFTNMLPHGVHEKHHDGVEWLHETGVIYIMLGAFGMYAILGFLNWLVNRFTDGVWPSERAMVAERRRAAAEYLASKKAF